MTLCQEMSKSDASPFKDGRTLQARSCMVGILAIVTLSFFALVFAGDADGYLYYVIGGTPVVGLAGASAMIILRKWSILAGFCFLLAASVVGLLHYLFWATGTSTV